MRGKRGNRSISLYKWIWHSYIHTVLIPLILIESIFIFIYFSSFTWSQGKNVSLLKDQAQSELGHIVNQEADSINHQLDSISNSVMLLALDLLQISVDTFCGSTPTMWYPEIRILFTS